MKTKKLKEVKGLKPKKVKVTKQTKMKSPLKQSTVAKLQKLQAYILEEPKRFNLNLWGEICNPKEYKKFDKEFESEYYEVTQQKPPCGTVGCIAGSACILSGDVKPKLVLKDLDHLEIYTFSYDTPKMAERYLGITRIQGLKLFYLKSWESDFGWPEAFEAALNNHEPGTLGYTKVAVKRIQHFIETGE